ncbi:MAG: hypothetical protein WAV28_16625 [Sedimentisphaerales bacterium]
MQKILINIDDPLNAGDRIELHFSSIGLAWLQATQIAIIEWQLKNHELFEILSWQLPSNNTVIFTVEVKKTNPILVTCAIIAGIIVVAGGGFLMLAKAFKIVVEAPAAPIVATTELIKQPVGQLLVIGLLIFLGLKFFK